jgi:putative transposase
VLSIRHQCRLLGLSRSGVYRTPLPASDDDLTLMRRINELFTAWPFLGSRRMARMLSEDGVTINRKCVQRLMRKMGIAALGPKPRTSKPAQGHRIYPYLLRGMTIDQPNQVWAADITYIPMGRGFLYLVAVIDWASRAVLSWRLSNTMDVSFCVDALEDALSRFGKPRIFNLFSALSTAFIVAIIFWTVTAGRRRSGFSTRGGIVIAIWVASRYLIPAVPMVGLMLSFFAVELAKR